MLWPFRRKPQPAKPLRTARLELVAITPELLAAEAAGKQAFAAAVQANIPTEWPPEHWEPHVHEIILQQLTSQPETTGYHRYILLRTDTAPSAPSSPAASSSGRVASDPTATAFPCTLVGCTGSFPKDHGDVELGYSTLPSYQRRGYATEAVTALVNWLFTKKEVHSVSAQTYPTLPESIKIMQRVGMLPAGQGDEPTTLRYRRIR